MSVQLFNTMSRSLEPLTPQHKNSVSLYTCGPTVYDYPQIGNLSIYIRWDTLVRTLQASGYSVNWVMNITDVGHLTSDADEGQDKLEKGAKREGKTAWQIAEFYTKIFLQNMQALHIQEPTKLPKATDHITEQIELIKKLEIKGFTYTIDDGVYFDTAKLPDYGKLARLDITTLRAGARVEFNQQKHRVTDFALWKFSPQGEKRDMEWDSPWGRGFPGWHLECSAMAIKYLGETLDIHAGGIDHIPVHHVNEIAQSETVTSKPFANIWLHSNFITVDGVKLSKSLQNSYTLQDITSTGFDPLDLRMLFLQSHYRSQADFTWENLEAAKNRRLSLQAFADLRWQLVNNDKTTFDFTKIQDSILKCLQNDLNTPQALAVLSGLELLVSQTSVTREQSASFLAFLEFLDTLFGFGLLQSQDITDEQKVIIKEREQARQLKSWVEADDLRTQLISQNIAIRDTAFGTIWYRV